jgi:hypothetical protein
MIRADLFWVLVLVLILLGVIELGEWLKRKSSAPRKHFRR